MPRRASHPGRPAWSTAAWRDERGRLVTATETDEARCPRRCQLDARLRRVRLTHGVGDPQRLGRSSGAGEQGGPSGVDGRDLLGIGEALACRVVGGKGAVEISSSGESGGGEALRQVRPLEVAQLLVPHRGHDAFDLLVVALHAVGVGEHFGAFARRDHSVVVHRLDETHRQRRVATDECQPGGVQKLAAGYLTAGVDPPQGDLDDVLPPPRPARFDEVCLLLVDPPQSQRRQPGAEHLPVQGVRQTERGSPARGHDGDQPARLQRLQRRRAVDVLEVVEAETLAHRQQLEHRQPGWVDAGQVLGHELFERGGRRQRRGQVPHVARLHQDAALSRPSDQLGQHLEVATRQAGELGERVRRDRAIERSMEQGAELVV